MSNTVDVKALAREARRASRLVAVAPSTRRERAMHETADALMADAEHILAENARDVDAGTGAGLSAALIDRLRLDETRLASMADGLRQVAALPDPVGSMERTRRRPNGLEVGKQRIPLGVIAMIYEARPNVTTDAFALCLRAGNACILRGGKEALATNRAVAAAVTRGLGAAGLPETACQLVPTADRDVFLELLQQENSIDLVIPRGGEGLIRFVAEHSRIPVIKHYKGVCHVYVDAAADIDMALAICENAKVQRPGVCNACETILVHDDIAEAFVPRLVERLVSLGVEIRADPRIRALAGGPPVAPATDADYYQEYLDLIVAMKTVKSLEAAVDHIETYGSSHTEAIVTGDYAAARRFVDLVHSSTVVVNASTRFADGSELGLGAEIGISTSKLHAYGPMGADELTTTRFVVFGDGHVRQ